MNSKIVSGSFWGSDIEPGTFHQTVMVDPENPDDENANTGGDNTDAKAFDKSKLA